MSNLAFMLMIKFNLDNAQGIGAALIAERDERLRTNAEAATPANYTTLRDDDAALIIRRKSQWQR